ncbi:MAG: LLM class flavin-dependent oxidoreductase, partial [Chloroflexota bacterium]
MPAVRFSVLCLPNVPWDILVERVARAERLGFDVAALPDHFVDWTNPPSPWFEGWTALTGLAATTSTIRLATCVTQIPFRNPALFARQALTLDHISGGRLEIGLGTGLVGDPSYAMAGIDDWEPRERVDRLAEYAEIVDRLLRDEVTTFAGTYYRTDGAIVNPRPVQRPRPPLTIGALGPVMLRHAARLADTWSTLSFKGSF